MFIVIAIIIFFIVMPQTRPFMIGLLVIIGLGVLVGLISPDFILEEPWFWCGLFLLVLSAGMLISYIADWRKKDREDRYKY